MTVRKPHSDDAEKNALAIVNFARGMLQDIEDFNASSNVKLFMRIGINSGNLIAGVIGKTKFVYDIWGDTVNVASRMESSGESSKIHVSEFTRQLTKDAIKYISFDGSVSKMLPGSLFAGNFLTQPAGIIFYKTFCIFHILKFLCPLQNREKYTSPAN